MLEVRFASQEQFELTLYAFGMVWDGPTTWARPHDRLEGMIRDLMIVKPATIKEVREHTPAYLAHKRAIKLEEWKESSSYESL